jgi:hypothetical protein
MNNRQPDAALRPAATLRARMNTHLRSARLRHAVPSILASAVVAGLLQLTFTTPAPRATLASSGYSLRFSGTGSGDIDRVKIPITGANNPVNIGAGDFTIEFWMKAQPGDNGSAACQSGGDAWIYGNTIIDRDIFGSGDYGDYGISLYGGRIAFGVHNGSTGATLCGASNVADGALSPLRAASAMERWRSMSTARSTAPATGRMAISAIAMAVRRKPATPIVTPTS